MKLNDSPERKLAVQIMAERAGDVAALFAAVKTACDALLSAAADEAFADEAAVLAAVQAQVTAYTGVSVPGLGDVSDWFTFA